MAQDLPSERPYRVRAYQAADAPFIYATWLNSFKPYRDRRVPRDLYYTEQHNLITRLMRDSVQTGFTLVACNRDDADQTLGWLVGDYRPDTTGGRVLHYVFTKALYRGMGVAAALLKQFAHEAAPITGFTHHTPAVPFLRMTGLLPAAAIYNPYLLHKP